MVKALSKKQMTELSAIMERGDRTGYYMKYYDFTGSDSTLLMAKISSFSGMIGGIAKEANKLLETNPNYPKEGVIWFSEMIAKEHHAKVKQSYDSYSKGILSDIEVYNAVQTVWGRLNLKEFFPGNPLISFCNFREALALEAQTFGRVKYSYKEKFKWAWGNLTKESIAVNSQGFVNYILSDQSVFSLKAYEHFRSNNQYDRLVSKDCSHAYFVDRSSNKTVHVHKYDTTQKVGKIYIVKALSKDEVARRCKVSVERVVEVISNDLLFSPPLIKKFMIISEPSEPENSRTQEIKDLDDLNANEDVECPTDKELEKYNEYALDALFSDAIENECIDTVRLLLNRYKVKIQNNPSYFNELAMAIRRGSLEILKLLVDHGGDLSIEGVNFLKVAILETSPNIDIISYLVAQGAQANPYTLSRVVSDKRIDILEVLLKIQSINLNYADWDSENPLEISVSQNDLHITEMLLKAGADPNVKLHEVIGNHWKAGEVRCYLTLLKVAITLSNLAMVELLLKYGADPNILSVDVADIYIFCPTFDFSCPLEDAIKTQNILLMQLLLKYDANPNIAKRHSNSAEEEISLFDTSISTQNPLVVNLLLQYNIDLNGNEYSRNPIVKAIKQNNYQTVESILKYSVTYQKAITKDNLLNALLSATEQNNYQITAYIFKYYPSLDLNNNQGNCALVEANIHSNLPMVNVLIAHGADVNGGCSEIIGSLPFNKEPISIKRLISAVSASNTGAKNFPLHEAVKTGSIDTARLLLQQNANTNQENYFEETPLKIALEAKTHDIVALLLEYGADPNHFNSRIKEDGYHESENFHEYHDTFGLLHIAVFKHDQKSVELLLRYGANPNVKTTRGWAPLTIATIGDKANTIIARLLINNGANVTTELYGTTLVQILIKEASKYKDPSRTEMIKLLIGAEFNVNYYFKDYYGIGYSDSSKYGNSPLEAALMYDSYEVVSLLLENGVNPNAPNAPIYSSLYQAYKNLNPDIIYKMLSYGAYPNIDDIPEVRDYNEIAQSNIVESFELILQFGGSSETIATFFTWYKDESEETLSRFSSNEILESLEQNEKTLIEYYGSSLTSPTVSKEADNIDLNKPGYYWGLQGDDIFTVHQDISMTFVQQVSSNFSAIVELQKHKMIIMDFGASGERDQIKFAEHTHIKSVGNLQLVVATIHERNSTTVVDNRSQEELVSLCGILPTEISEEHFIFN